MTDKEKGLPPADLTGAFAPSRKVGLGGLARITPAAPSEKVEEELAAARTKDTTRDENSSDAATLTQRAPEGTPPAPTASRRRKEPKTAQGEGRVARSGNKSHPVYVPATVMSEFTKRRDATGTTNTLLFMDAVDSLIDKDAVDPLERLRTLVEETLVGDAPTSVFARVPTRATTSFKHLERPTQLVLRLDPDNQAVLQDLVQQTGAKDRSHFATVVLVNYLEL